MRIPRYRAWRFVHPDFDRVTEEFAGIVVSPRGAIEMVEEQASVRQAILLLLSTRPGERVMRPTYGCELYSLVFATNDDTTAGLAIHFVRRALTMWEPRIDILHLDANSSDDGVRLDIVLDYRLRSTQRHDRLTYSVPLAGEQG
jgi:phage baseplate assembly protein W